MATHTDRIMVVSPTGVPTRVAANDTVELSSGNLKVGGDLTANGEVTLDTTEAVNISADAGINISSGGSAIELDPTTDTIDVDSTGVFGVAAASANFISGDNTATAFLVEDSAGSDYFKIVTSDSSEEVVFGNNNTNPDFNFTGSGRIIITTFQAAETIYAGQALCLTSETTIGIANAATLSKAHIVGISLENAAQGSLVKMIAIPGIKASIKTALPNSPSVGSEVYLSSNPGDFTTTAPSVSGSTVFKAGYVLSSNQILFQPQFIRINS